MKKIMIAIMALGLAGCATDSIVSVKSGNLKADHLVYFEQSDRVPKDVLLAAYASKKQTPEISVASVDQWTQMMDTVSKLLDLAPNLAEKYSNERMNNALLNRRMLFVGYDKTNELEQIKAIVEQMGKAFETTTPKSE